MLGYEALRTHAAWKDLSARGRILAHGEDNTRLLHAMSSNHVQALAEGQGCYAFFLNAQGRIQGDATILRVGADLLIDVEAVAAQRIFHHLDQYIIADDVTLEDLAESHFEIGIEGPAALEVAGELGVPAPEGIVRFAGGYVARLSETGLPGVRLILPVAERETWIGKLQGVEQADDEAWEVVRHEQGKPRFGVEILEKHLIQETRLLHGVHFSKGCYLGQEIVERVRARGAVHKGLAAISIETATPPALDTEVLGEKGKVGNLLSVVYSPAEGKTIAIAMLAVDALSGTQPMTVGGVSASLRASSSFAGH
ncbi:YgfZ/GcvT domain-containing protein [Bryobacter aggregatus]|uniref:CAF17-like 4Fe-4S cluster assembly/insertion protein YgfZ n=1 Tax=Bryobacter aggregatus TaxID=360054 RepID=UPI0004E272B0|nr:folate-binding protein YgfZ [Bryobacter aggregatus]